MTSQVDPGSGSAAQIRSWLVARVAALMGVAPDHIDAEQPFANYGLDSVAAVGLVGELEEHLGIEIPATVMWDFPTIAQLAQHLAA